MTARKRYPCDTVERASLAPNQVRVIPGYAPEHVLEERARVEAAPRTLSQTYLGDPLPGRSAFDRMFIRRQNRHEHD